MSLASLSYRARSGPQTRVVQITEDYLWHCLWFAMPWNPANSEVGATGRFTMFDLAAKVRVLRVRGPSLGCRPPLLVHHSLCPLSAL